MPHPPVLSGSVDPVEESSGGVEVHDTWVMGIPNYEGVGLRSGLVSFSLFIYSSMAATTTGWT